MKEVQLKYIKGELPKIISFTDYHLSLGKIFRNSTINQMLVLMFLLKKNDVSLTVEDEVKSNNEMFFISLDKSLISLERGV